MSGQCCGLCGWCLLKPGSVAPVAPCELRMRACADTVYVEVDVDLDCTHFVSRDELQESWTDEQRHALAQAAEHMKVVTGHRLDDCMIEISRIVRDYLDERCVA